MPSWQQQPISELKKEFTDHYILRLFATKPAKLVDLLETKQILSDIKKLRFFSCIPGGFRTDGQHVPTYMKRRGWNDYASKYDKSKVFYITTLARIAKLDLLIESMEQRVNQLVAEERQAAEVQQRSLEAAEQFELAENDEKLSGALWHAIHATPRPVGFVYFKRWTMPDGTCWFKVGITNNPDRRETEQNVLPVPAESIACIDVGSMDRARVIEAAIHKVLEEQRIMDSNNRELFNLSNRQALAVKVVLERFERTMPITYSEAQN
jgi:hypothetical protein